MSYNLFVMCRVSEPTPFSIPTASPLSFEQLRADLIGSEAVIRTPFGERCVTYADYVASSKPLRSVEDQLGQMLPLYANTHTEDSATGAYSTNLTHQASEYIKQQLGGNEDYKLVFCGSGSTAAVHRLQEILGLIVPQVYRQIVLSQLPPEQRPVVFVGPYEHHSNEVTWRETLAEVVEIPLCEQGTLNVEALAQALQDPAYAGRPKIGSFSAASNVTGLLTDTRKVAKLLHQHGAYAFFDFAASGPYVEIDMRPDAEDGYDAVFLSPHKFVGGVGTPGLLCFHQKLYQLSSPTTAGGGTVRYVTRDKHSYVSDIEMREDAGTPAILGKLKMALAFRTKERLGIDNIMQREHQLFAKAVERLTKNPRLRLLGNLEAPRLAFLSFITLCSDGKQLHPRLVVRLLNDLFGIQARGGCACAGPYGHALLNLNDEQTEAYYQCVVGDIEGLKPGWTRLNLAPWASQAEVDFILNALEFVAEYGERFVPLYQFDWAVGAWTHSNDYYPPNFLHEAEGDESAPVHGGPVPYAEYLQKARDIAEQLAMPQQRSLPPELSKLPTELVYFAY